ncbi:MAG: acetate--CoA ligase family protein, partial [Anaerolineales bacterium]|nr:acetate--CoA ligase family protein [Anaerolineales bacterium]
MKLHEYYSKRRFSEYGIPIPKGEIAETPQEAQRIAEKLGGPVVVKSQVLVGGRGKAGGIKVAQDPKEAYQHAEDILKLTINGLPVRKVLVDEAADIKDEIYLGITNDRAARKPVIMASAEGGIDIEEVAHKTPEKIIKCHIDPLMGLQSYQSRDLAAGIDLARDQWRAFGKIAHGLWQAYIGSDATLAEINPLVVTGEGQLLAVDGKMVLDDNALFRHPDLEEYR